ncbi:hypothetical protein G9A89_022425 [Geosiphon pyriformis]|nr:hypothetical protein G9A89_022425 [Geosiphon pyriformis]
MDFKTSTNKQPSETVTESEDTGTNHLEFTKFLFQHYHTYLGLTNNSWPIESAFNYYINKRIVYHLGGQRDPKSAFNNFFSKLLICTPNYKNKQEN